MNDFELYEEKYGHVPDTQEEIIKYIEENFRINEKKLKENEEMINGLQWKELKIDLPIVPKPTPRARYNFKTKHFYVEGAKRNKEIIQHFIDDLDIIYTRTHLLIKTFQPTPMSSMSNHEIYLAEKGLICPIQDPDWDNLGKTYSDMIQGILLLNDNLVQIGTVEKYFSLKPRVEIYIRYQDTFDSKFNKRKVTNSTSFNKMNLSIE